MKNPDKSGHAHSIIALSFVCGAAVYSQSVQAEIYTYVDKDGTSWLTNTPKKGKKYKLVAKYGAPQKKSRSVAAPSLTSSFRSYAPGNLPVASAGIPGRHCGGQTYAQLERKLDPHLGSLRLFAQQYGVEENLVRAVMKQESCFNSRALSNAGAVGLMQLMPGTADQMGIGNAWDPHQNIQGGIKYLGQMLREFNGDKQLALAAYNAGPGAVRKYNGIPPYRETQTYVSRIMAEYNSLQTRQVAAQGFQRNAGVSTGARGYGWAKPVQDFSVFRGLQTANR
jgi:soluble lytic murein transglycosylase-like protein